MMHPLAADRFFDLSDYAHAELFRADEPAWTALTRLAEYVAARARRDLQGEIHPKAEVEGEVFVAAGARIEAGAYVIGPALIEEGAVVKHGAYLRGNVILGPRAILGHAGEAKGSIFFPTAQAPHFAYVGDSILGAGTNLGAGTKLSNLKVTHDEIEVLFSSMGKIRTGLRKFGAIVGDGTQTGCNSVLNPGTLLGKNVLVYANATVRGVVPENTIVKLSGSIVTSVPRRS